MHGNDEVRFVVHGHGVVLESDPREENYDDETFKREARTLLAFICGGVNMRTWDEFWKLVGVKGKQEKRINDLACKIWDEMWQEQHPVADDENQEDSQV